MLRVLKRCLAFLTLRPPKKKRSLAKNKPKRQASGRRVWSDEDEIDDDDEWLDYAIMDDLMNNDE